MDETFTATLKADVTANVVRNDDKVTVVGVVTSIREKQNKEKGTRFGFFTLEDLTGTAEVICWGSRPAQGNRVLADRRQVGD